MTIILITIGLVVVLTAVVVVLVRRQLTPPVEANVSAQAMHLDVHRAPIQNVTITVDNRPPVFLDELGAGTTQIPWSRFGIAANPARPAPNVQQIVITARYGARWFKTTIGFGSQPNVEYISQAWSYIDAPDAPTAPPDAYTAAPENP